MPLPVDPRKKPASVKVHVSSGAGVDVEWEDGHASHFDFTYLRDECPCAMCNDERDKKAQMTQQASAGSDVFPMYKPKLKAQGAHAVGNYALRIDFTDGHSTGIYSFDYLRTICPCEACAREYRPKP